MNELTPHSAHSLARYDVMVRAIAECARVDEVKDMRDKAMALETYYRQARNVDAEREAANVRLRAERRAGELLKELARATPQEVASAGGVAKSATSHDRTKHDVMSPPVTQQSPYAAALSDTGMSRQTAHQFQALADIPDDEFEDALVVPEKPSRAAMLRKVKPQPKVSDDALLLWGALCDFEREGYLTSIPDDLFERMTEPMREDIFRLAPVVAEFLNNLEVYHDPT